MSNTISTDRIFSQESTLRNIKIYIDDIFISEEDVVSIDFENTFNVVSIIGKIIIKDSINIYRLIDLNESTKIKLDIIDNFGKIINRYFNITSVNIESWNADFRYLRLTFIDSLSFMLSTSYISKSFYDTPVNAILQIFDYLGVEKNILTPNNLLLLVKDDNDKVNFIVPSDRSVLEFFMYLFRNYGCRFWQTIDGVIIGRYLFNNLQERTESLNGTDTIIKYTNNTSNHQNPFMIYDYRILTNQTLELNTKNPSQFNFNSFDGKMFDVTSIKLSDLYDGLALGNQDLSNISFTFGEKYTNTTSPSIYNQLLTIEDVYFKNTQLEIIVKGNFTANPLGHVVLVDLKGNPTIVQSDISGDTTYSGKYFVYRAQEKIIGDKHISKLTLVRMNNN
jgi:hypothetical protein